MIFFEIAALTLVLMIVMSTWWLLFFFDSQSLLFWPQLHTFTRLQIIFFISRSFVRSETRQTRPGLTRKQSGRTKKIPSERAKLRIQENNLFHCFNCTILITDRSFNSCISSLISLFWLRTWVEAVLSRPFFCRLSFFSDFAVFFSPCPTALFFLAETLVKMFLQRY